MLLHICSGSAGAKYGRRATEWLCGDVWQQYLIQSQLQTNLMAKGKKTHRAQEEEEEAVYYGNGGGYVSSSCLYSAYMREKLFFICAPPLRRAVKGWREEQLKREENEKG